MCINYKQALLAGVINYAVIFLIISGMMATPLWGTETVKYVNMAIGFVIAYLVAWNFYFKAKPADWLKEGLCLGLVMTAVAVVIEIPVMVYGFAAAQGWSWFTQWNMLASYAFGIVACMVAAKMKK